MTLFVRFSTTTPKCESPLWYSFVPWRRWLVCGFLYSLWELKKLFLQKAEKKCGICFNDWTQSKPWKIGRLESRLLGLGGSPPLHTARDRSRLRLWYVWGWMFMTRWIKTGSSPKLVPQTSALLPRGSNHSSEMCWDRPVVDRWRSLAWFFIIIFQFRNWNRKTN